MKRRNNINKYLQGSPIESMNVPNKNNSYKHSKKLAQIIATSAMMSAMTRTGYSKICEENENERN